MQNITVRFMALRGTFAVVRTEQFASFDAAKSAVQAHVGAKRTIKLACDGDDDLDEYRFVCGRSTVAYAAESGES